MFDNSTIDAHAGGTTATLDLPMGHVGVHVPGGTILPLQKAALVTEDVRASALTLLVALPHLEPFTDLDKAAHTSIHSNSGQQWQGQGPDTQLGLNRKVLASSGGLMALRRGKQAAAAEGLHRCGVSQPGRATACGQVFMDDGQQLQVKT